MLRTNRKIVKCVCALGLSVAVLISTQAGTSLAIADDTSYTTATVERGTLLTQAQAKASVYYPESTSIVFSSDYGFATFVEFKVVKGEMVEAGQVIAEVYTEVDDIAWEELNLQLQRAEEDYAEFIERMEADLQAAEEAAAVATGDEKRIAELKLEKQQSEYAKRFAMEESSILALREKKEIYDTVEGVAEIVAPVSGRVGWLGRYYGGDTIWNGTVIGGIYDTSEMLFTVKDMTGVLRYGMKLTLKDDQGKEYEGTVISTSSKALTPSLIQEVAYIKVEGANPMLGHNAVYETIRMENVLLVNASAVRNDTNGSYVLLLVDGKPMKRYIATAKIVNGQCYVLSGLEEGTTVIIN